MNFKQLQDSVLSDRFTESFRSHAMDWINYRYGSMWAADDWVFRVRKTTVTITGATVTNAPANLGPIRELLLADGTRLAYVESTRFFARYTPTSSSAAPEAYTVLGGAIFVGPSASGSITGCTLIDDQRVTLLVGDSDVPALPTEFHFALVLGGQAIGLKLQNDPTWIAFESDWTNALAEMREDYLEDERDLAQEAGWGRYRPWGM